MKSIIKFIEITDYSITYFPGIWDTNFPSATYYHNNGYKAHSKGNQLIISNGHCEFRYAIGVTDEAILLNRHGNPRGYEILDNIAKLQTSRLIRSINAGV